MLLHPHAQKAAQSEIDAIIGPDRLPTFSDRQSLPYVNALFKEVFRWNTIGAMGLPHNCTADDTIVVKTPRGEEEYNIPKGSMLISATWWFMRDPSRYTDPDTFKPERFLGDKPETDPSTLVFGFGRRICPGRVLADASSWLVVAQTLAVFSVERAKDERGRELEVQAEGIPGLVYHPVPFEDKMKMSVREGRKGLLEQLEGAEVWETGDAELLK